MTDVPNPPGLRPQTLLMTVLGIHVSDPGLAVYSGSVIDVLERIGVSEQATRSIVSRMARRGMLHRIRSGRRSYLAPTEPLRAAMLDGKRRIWDITAVNRTWDGTWTLVAFSLPDSWSRQRHDLRSRLVWAGFGMLHPGLWVAPGPVDVATVVAGLELEDYVTVTRGTAAPPTEAADLVRRGFDLSGVAADYKSFMERWGHGQALPGDTIMTRELLLHCDWLQLIRRDPHLPAVLLPADWPAIEADRLFLRLATDYTPKAEAEAAKVLEIIRTG